MLLNEWVYTDNNEAQERINAVTSKYVGSTEQYRSADLVHTMKVKGKKRSQ